ncbi:transglycosylase domain-containing protein [Canibacter sp. lx-72]|uniref:transglycosylase domain-containing protein n=1 Tax=Canibacter zhuwentaonis TaxID=2837491 RepID=UPI001BDD67FA|nr:transglycosylase domain-containing protein [Canibacter zhuwentaonis]MBT1018533.1 transglycosylase domain-containing protein [Canibacter zhuwentaonis]
MSSISKTPRKVYSFKPRTPGGRIGALIGAAVMSVIAGVLLTVAVTPVVALSGATASTAISLFENLPGYIDPGRLSRPSEIYAKGKNNEEVLITRFYAQNRQMVKWNQIAQSVKDAAVSEEDPRFYTHGGVDVLAAARAVAQKVTRSGHSGASTITMQYVRNVLVQEAELIADKEEREKAYVNATREDIDRKLKEMRLAISIEKRYSKDDILLGYLNIANYGGRIYGIQAAAHAYYSKNADELSIAEAASLVGIVNSPATLNLRNPDNYEANEKRRNRIIGSMLREGRITQEQHDEAIATPVEPKLSDTTAGCSMAEDRKLGHFCDYIVNYLRNDSRFGDTPEERWFRLQNGGFKIMSTIDLDLQQAATDGMAEYMPATRPGIDYGGAAVSVSTKTGEVLAMTQNRPFSDVPEFVEEHPEYTSINYNTDYEYGGSHGFQYGSVAKAFTMAEWLNSGHNIRERVNVGGRTVNFSSFRASCLPNGVYGGGSFTFRNHNLASGVNTVLHAMDNSLNGGFVSMAQKLDLCKIFDVQKAMGVHRAAAQNTEPSLSNYGTKDLTIVPAGVFNGNDEVSPLTMATAYAGFANNGKVCKPSPIASIHDFEGKEVAFTKASCKQAIPENVAHGVLYTLEHYITSGIGGFGRGNTGVPRYGKTGTTDNNKDNWWVGGSTEVATAVWHGNVTGNTDLMDLGIYRNSGKVWRDIMNSADRKYKGEAFPRPSESTLQPRQQQVPDITGQQFEEAKHVLEAAGFIVEQAGSEHSDKPEGQVLRMESDGDTVRLIVSNGIPGTPRLPGELTGISAQEAANRLGAAGYYDVVMQCSSGGSPHPRREVTSVSPAPGTEANHNTRITLTIKCR